MDFFRDYLAYTSGGESPLFYHRWAAICGLGAYLGRDYYFQHGHFNINPNIYAMIIGVSGTRKSAAILQLKKVLQAAGYTSIAAEKTSKEKFILDLAGEDLNAFGSTSANGTDFLGEMLGQPIYSGTEENDYKEISIIADEFNLFIGQNNMEFISLLGVLWDYNGPYKNRIKTGKSIEMLNPTVSILGGNTATGFAQAFPPEILSQGFFSRLILVYGEPTGRKITFPKKPSKEDTNEIANQFRRIKSISRGHADFANTAAEKLLDKIYKSGVGVDDYRFESYNSRRLTHLIKLCLIISASTGAKQITEGHIIVANTILSHTEHLMPKALGEFGKAKHSDISHKIMQIIDASAPTGLLLKDIWIHVAQDLDSIPELAKLLQNLLAAGKIQNVHGYGFLPMKKLLIEHSSDTVDYSLLTEEERNTI